MSTQGTSTPSANLAEEPKADRLEFDGLGAHEVEADETETNGAGTPGPDKAEADSVGADIARGEIEARLFKRSVIMWTLRLGGALLGVTALIGGRAVILGAVFGLCIGLTSFELMTRFNTALLRSGGRGGVVAAFGWAVRLALLLGAAVAVYWKGWNYVTAAIGCFLVYPVLIAHGLLGNRRRAAPSSVDAKE